MALEKELATYRAKLPDLLQDEGKFVVIHGDTIEGTYDTYLDALKVGYSTCGLSPFMVKEVHLVERALYFTRDLWPT